MKTRNTKVSEQAKGVGTIENKNRNQNVALFMQSFSDFSHFCTKSTVWNML